MARTGAAFAETLYKDKHDDQICFDRSVYCSGLMATPRPSSSSRATTPARAT